MEGEEESTGDSKFTNNRNGKGWKRDEEEEGTGDEKFTNNRNGKGW
jgi:hypothetical protein